MGKTHILGVTPGSVFGNHSCPVWGNYMGFGGFNPGQKHAKPAPYLLYNLSAFSKAIFNELNTRYQLVWPSLFFHTTVLGQ